VFVAGGNTGTVRALMCLAGISSMVLPMTVLYLCGQYFFFKTYVIFFAVRRSRKVSARFYGSTSGSCTAGFTQELIFVELRKSKFSVRCGRTPLSTISKRQDFCTAAPILRFTAAAKVRSKESSLFLLRATKRCNDVNN
jgi:hypothetical protein